MLVSFLNYFEVCEEDFPLWKKSNLCQVTAEKFGHCVEKATFQGSNTGYMKNDKELHELDSIINGKDNANVPLNTTFSASTFDAIERYRKEKGYPYPQDVVRIAVANLLSKLGYL